MKRIVSVVLSLFSLSLSIFPANAQDGTAEPVSREWQSRKWEGVMEANLNGNFSTSSRYYVAEYTIGMKYCLAERWSLGFECVGVAPFAFQDRQQTFSSVIDLGLSGTFRIISEDRDRMDLNIGIGSSVLAYSNKEYNLYCDLALHYSFLYDRTARVNPYFALGISYRHPYRTDLYNDKVMLSAGVGFWFR